jgi:hypothetical protein
LNDRRPHLRQQREQLFGPHRFDEMVVKASAHRLFSIVLLAITRYCDQLRVRERRIDPRSSGDRAGCASPWAAAGTLSIFDRKEEECSKVILLPD